jgi:galactokinase
MCSKTGRLVQYSFSPICLEREVPLPAGHTLVIASSGVVAEKTGEALAKYNRVSRSISVILDQWQEKTGKQATSLAAVLRSDPMTGELLRETLGTSEPGEFSGAELIARLDQFLAESERIIPATADALAAGGLADVGLLIDESQAWAERALGNQVPATIFLAAEAAHRLGAVAASAFGAGFGGAVWALVKSSGASAFCEEWAAAYRARFPVAAEHATFFLTGAGPAALRV